MKRRIIYLLAEAWPTHRADVAVLFGKYLPKFGVASDIVTVVDPNAGGPEIGWSGGSALVKKVSRRRGFKHLAKLLHNIRTLLYLNQSEYVAVQVRDMPFSALVALFIARFKGLPCYYWMSYPISESDVVLAHARGLTAGLGYFGPLLRGLIGQWILYRLVLPGSDHIFVQSEKMREDVMERGIRRERMTVVPMGVDLEAVSSSKLAATEDPRLRGKRVLVYLGTLHRSRRVDILLEMVGLVAKDFPDVLLVMIGDVDEASYAEWLKERARELSVEQYVYWLGWLPMEMGWSYLKMSEVGLSPYPRSYELDSCSPTKVVEYFSFGLPVVGNDQPEQERMMRESRGGLCVEWSACGFATAVHALLCDEDLRLKMGRQALEYVTRERSYEVLATHLANNYQSLIQSEL